MHIRCVISIISLSVLASPFLPAYQQPGSLETGYEVEAALQRAPLDSGLIFRHQKSFNRFADEDVQQNFTPRSVFQDEYPAAGESLSIDGPISDQWAIASQTGLKISVNRDAWYRITQQQMVAAGFNPVVDIKNLQLFNNARELAILTNRARGAFVSGDYIEFYGQALDTPFTANNIYYLLTGSTEGRRISQDRKRSRSEVRPETTNFAPILKLPILELYSTGWFWWLLPPQNPGRETKRERQSESSSDHEPVRPPKAQSKKGTRSQQEYAHRFQPEASALEPNFEQIVERRERLIYFVSLLNGDNENFFGQVINTSPVILSLNVPHAELSAGNPPRLEVALQGASHDSHVITVQFNDTTVGTLNFFGLNRKVQTFDVPLSLLREGDNRISLMPRTGSGLTLIDHTRLSYRRKFRAESDLLRFAVSPAQVVRVDGFTTFSIRVIDYSDPLNVTLLRPLVELNDNGYAIQIPASRSGASSPRLIHAFPESLVNFPANLSINQPSTLHSDTNGADLLVIAHQNLIPNLAPLVNLRINQGLMVSVVDVEDIYDEFSFGRHGPHAIRDFLELASTRWVRPPRYVILAGDASYDPRDYLGFGQRDLVPTKLVDATFNETSSDDWFTDFDDDGIANIPVGRLPAATASQANTIIQKIVNFSPGNVPQSALLIADSQRNYYFNFEQANTEIQALLPANLVVQRVDRRTELSDNQASINIVSKMNSGQALVNYSGHGNVNTWTDGSIFTSDLAVSLSNGDKLPLVVVMDCLNGYFHEPSQDFSGLAEALLQAPNGGAVAAFASSGLTIPDGQHAMVLELYRILYGSQTVTLGEAIKAAKTATSDIDVRRTWIFFGDPSMKIR